MATLLAAAALAFATGVDPILFERHGRIWQVGIDGKNPACLTERYVGTQFSPDWDPEHRKIAFINQVPGKSQIWTLLSQGAMLVGPCPDTAKDLTWGASDALYYGYSCLGGSSTVFAIRRVGPYDGQNRDLFSSSFESHPTVNGNNLVWVRSRPGSPSQLWEAPLSGGGPHCLLPTSALDPVWSPDGSRLAFVSNQEGTWGLYLYEGGSSRRLMDLPQGYVRNPDWSPTGDRLVFETNWHLQEKRLLDKPGIAWIPVTGGTASWITEEAAHPAW